MEVRKKKLLENFLSLGALQIAGYIIPLIALPYQSRVLGVEKFGLVYFAYSVMGYFFVLTDYGFDLSATREISVNRHNCRSISNVFNSVFTIKTIIVITSYLLLWSISFIIPKIHDNWLLFQLTFLMVVGNAIFPAWFFQGMERMKYITFLNILSKLIFLISIFIFVKSENDYMLVPFLNSMGFIISGLIGFIAAVKIFKLKLFIPKISSIKKQFIYSTEFFLSRISATALTNTNTFCLGLISSNITVGYYVAAEKILAALKNLQMPVKNVIYPYIAKYKDLKLYKKIYFPIIIINFLICLIMFVFAKKIIVLFYGSEMSEAYKILRIFCLVVMITCPSTLAGYPLLGAMGYTKEANRAVIYTSVFHICGLLILCCFNKMNAYSIAYMILLSEAFLFMQWGTYIVKYKLLSDKSLEGNR